ncbi:hypothetical protein C5167_022429 [Papaver somniferum]|uniref:Uncharacterized protein n=1 Tax=Papaver somniferum TaxID=3469 RepID=A0A4Y7JKW9_PAPSO|nr:hypothetical protein C5167_022429 [Papaver somniferum]
MLDLTDGVVVLQGTETHTVVPKKHCLEVQITALRG